MGHIGSETRSMKKNIVQTPEAAYVVHVGIWVISGKKYRSLGQMKENLVNTGGCIQNNFLDVFYIAVHCIIKVSELYYFLFVFIFYFEI